MGKLGIVVVLISMVLATPVAHGAAAQGSPKAVEKWFKNLKHKKEKVTRLHFYFHDQVSGNNISAIQVAQSNITSTLPTSFGLIRMADNLLTVGPDPNSKIIGRAQGLYALAGLNDVDILMNFNLVFMHTKYNGSTLSLYGWNPILHKYREMSIVGGSGVFRLPRGIATAKTHMYNATSGNAIVEYHVIIEHY